MGGNFFGAREVRVTLQVGLNDIASIELPRLGENGAGAFANHQFSIRLRTKQLR